MQNDNVIGFVLILNNNQSNLAISSVSSEVIMSIKYDAKSCFFAENHTLNVLQTIIVYREFCERERFANNNNNNNQVSYKISSLA